MPIVVRFNSEIHTIFLENDFELRQDDVVTIRYNPTDHGDFSVNGQINEHPLSADLIALSLCVSSIPVALGVYLAVTLRRVRRILKSSEWCREPVKAARYNSHWSKDKWVLQLTDSAPLLSPNYTFWYLRHPTIMVQVAGHPKGPAVMRARARANLR